jgi:hypothetical protein
LVSLDLIAFRAAADNLDDSVASQIQAAVSSRITGSIPNRRLPKRVR